MKRKSAGRPNAIKKGAGYELPTSRGTYAKAAETYGLEVAQRARDKGLFVSRLKLTKNPIELYRSNYLWIYANLSPEQRVGLLRAIAPKSARTRLGGDLIEREIEELVLGRKFVRAFRREAKQPELGL